MNVNFIARWACSIALVSLAMWGGSGSDSMTNPSPATPQNARRSVLMSIALSPQAIVKVFGIPQAGSLKAYVVFYYTGDMPGS